MAALDQAALFAAIYLTVGAAIAGDVAVYLYRRGARIDWRALALTGLIWPVSLWLGWKGGDA